MRFARAKPSRNITLPVRGYRQNDDYSCGALAGWSVVEFLNHHTDFGGFYKACAPNKRWGTSTAKLSAAMRRYGVTVSIRKDLDFAALKSSLEQGWPILLTISTVTEQFWHWVVIYGVGWNPQQVYISASLPGRALKEVVSWRTFQKHWRPHGSGLVCKPKPQTQIKSMDNAQVQKLRRMGLVNAKVARRRPAA